MAKQEHFAYKSLGGELQKQDLGPEEDWDVSVSSMEELADALGA